MKLIAARNMTGNIGKEKHCLRLKRATNRIVKVFTLIDLGVELFPILSAKSSQHGLKIGNYHCFFLHSLTVVS
jgi:hypothetical protein